MRICMYACMYLHCSRVHGVSEVFRIVKLVTSKNKSVGVITNQGEAQRAIRESGARSDSSRRNEVTRREYLVQRSGCGDRWIMQVQTGGQTDSNSSRPYQQW